MTTKKKTTTTTTKSAAKKATKAEAIQKVSEDDSLAVLDLGEDFDGEDGFEQFGKEDIKRPFLLQLQPLSPPVVSRQSPDCVPGNFINTATGKTYEMEKGVVFIPVRKIVHYVEYKTRGKGGGGFVASHALNSDYVKEFNESESEKPFKERRTKSGNMLVESHEFYCMILSDDGLTWTGDFAIFSCQSMKIPACRALCTALYTQLVPVKVGGKVTRRRVPLFLNRVRLTGYQDQKNNDIFWNIRFSPLREDSWEKSLVKPTAEPELYAAAREQFKATAEMNIEEGYASKEQEAAEGGEGQTVEAQGDALGF